MGTNGHGGRRAGGGRPKGAVKQTKTDIAARVLKGIGEEKCWRETIELADKFANGFTLTDKGQLVALDPTAILKAVQIKADVLKYLTDRRDGKAAQQIQMSGEPIRVEFIFGTNGHGHA